MSALAKISFYKSAKDVAPSGEITIVELCRKIRDGETAAGVAKVRAAGNEDEQKALKLRLLPAVQISGYVTTGKRKQAFAEGRFIHSGWLQVDIDKGGLRGKSAEEVKTQLASDPHILAAFISPSGKGAKGLFRIPVCTSEDEHKSQFLAVEKYLAEKHQIDIDKSTKDHGRLCYLPSDPAIIYNPDPVEFVAPAEVVENVRNCGQTPKTEAQARPLASFPEPPENGIHTWLATAAWHCRLKEKMSEAETVAKLESYDGKLRRRLTPNEARDAARTVFSTILRPNGTARIVEAAFPENLPDLTRFGESDADNAERVFAVAGGNFHHVSDSGQWLIWNGYRWTPDRDGAMTRIFLRAMAATAKQAFDMANRKAGESLVRHAMKSRDSAKVTAGLAMLKAVAGVTISAGDLDSDPWLLGTPNGLVDLRTGRPIPPDRAALVTKSIACDVDGEAACPIWENVIATAAGGDMELIRFLQAWTGYTLTGCVSEECLAFLHGTGANSKGTVTECVRALLGDYAITAPESLFVADRNTSATNDVARLAGCRMACAAELDENASFAESRLKSITSRDAITARFLHREFFDFVPTHKFWISGNHKPTVRGVDLGIWRRLRLIPFNVTIPKENRDPNLADKLRGELTGILNWALEGCRIWQAEGLKTPACVAKATEDYQKAEDIIGQFLEQCTTSDEKGRVLQSSLFECYQAWTVKQGIKHPLTATKFNRKIEERGFRRSKIRGGFYWHEIMLED